MYWDSRSTGLDIRVLILGSSALLMQEGLSESLAGRFFQHRCSHWSFAECHEAFDWNLEQWIYFGGYSHLAPKHLTSADNVLTHSMTISTELAQPEQKRATA
jgi:predicted AAA+ superfamily ATPase